MQFNLESMNVLFRLQKSYSVTVQIKLAIDLRHKSHIHFILAGKDSIISGKHSHKKNELTQN